MSLTTPPSVQKLQTALHDKAKGSRKFRYATAVYSGSRSRHCYEIKWIGAIATFRLTDQASRIASGLKSAQSDS